MRLKTWYYKIPLWFFMTICTDQRRRYFGEDVNGKMVLNEIGIIVFEEWINTKK